jgi:hypothetical protein
LPESYMTTNHVIYMHQFGKEAKKKKMQTWNRKLSNAFMKCNFYYFPPVCTIISCHTQHKLQTDIEIWVTNKLQISSKPSFVVNSKITAITYWNIPGKQRNINEGNTVSTTNTVHHRAEVLRNFQNKHFR